MYTYNSSTYLIQRLSVAVQRGNAASVLGSAGNMDPHDFLEFVLVLLLLYCIVLYLLFFFGYVYFELYALLLLKQKKKKKNVYILSLAYPHVHVGIVLRIMQGKCIHPKQPTKKTELPWEVVLT